MTARKTRENIQSTPIAVTAVTAADLKARSAQNIGDLSGVVPSLHAAGNVGGGSNSQSFFIRGVGQSDVLPTTDPAVGVYIDGIYLARTTGDLFDLADVQQIEVLRGPQGTLFGKNTSGGAISVTTHRPSGDLAGAVDATFGNFDRHDFKGNVEFPIIENTLAGSLSFASRDDDGYGKSLATGDRLGGNNLKAVRGALNYTGPNNMSYYLTADYTRTRDITDPLAILRVYPSSSAASYYKYVVAPQYTGAVYNNSLISSNPLDTFDDANDKNNLDVGGVSGIGTIQLGSVTLKSLTAFRAQQALLETDTFASPQPIGDNTRNIVEQQVTQEVQAIGKLLDNRISYVGGIFYEHEVAKIGDDQDYLPGLYGLLSAIHTPNPTDDTVLANTHQVDDSYAAYANLNIKLTSKLSGTAGLRYTAEQKTVDQLGNFIEHNASIYVSPTGGVLPRGAVISAQRDFYDLTPTLGLQYQATPDAYFYGTYSQGFKSGGFDGRPIEGLSAPASFAPETVENYEIGSKLEFFHHRARLNTAVFWDNYRNLQVQALVTQNTIAVDTTQNAGTARIRGVEFEATLIPIANLTLTASGSYLDAELLKLAAGVPFSINDKLQQTPKWSGDISANYKQLLPVGGSIDYRADYVLTSTIFNELPNGYSVNAAGTSIIGNGPNLYPTRQPGYALLDARITYTTPNRLWDLAAFATNLTDVRFRTFGFSDTFSSAAYFGPPREYGVELTRRF